MLSFFPYSCLPSVLPGELWYTLFSPIHFTEGYIKLSLGLTKLHAMSMYPLLN